MAGPTKRGLNSLFGLPVIHQKFTVLIHLLLIHFFIVYSFLKVCYVIENKLQKTTLT